MEAGFSFQTKSWDGHREEGMMKLLITQQVFHLLLLLPGDPKAGIGEGVTHDLQRKETERLPLKRPHLSVLEDLGLLNRLSFREK